MTTLLHTSEGFSAMHEIVESEMDFDRFLFWEALRLRANSIGARAALDEVMRFEGGTLEDEEDQRMEDERFGSTVWEDWEAKVAADLEGGL